MFGLLTMSASDYSSNSVHRREFKFLKALQLVRFAAMEVSYVG
jgi:hypothetical protein